VIGWLLALFSRRAAPVTAQPGGTFRRADAARVFRRSPDQRRAFRRADAARVFRRSPDQRRAFRRADAARVFRGTSDMATIQTDTCVKDASEVVSFVFDFSQFPEAWNEETLGTPVVDASAPAGLTIGTPAVTSADREEGRATVPSGYGIQVTVSGGTAGTTYSLECRGTFSGGGVRVVKGRLAVE
jgi:hypothetical protein